MSKSFNISIIGSGNVAWHLAQELEKQGHTIREVFSRNLAHAEELAAQLYCAQAQNHLDFTKSEARIFFIAVSDAAIEQIARHIQLPAKAILAHTSGSQSLEKLTAAPTQKTGVFYPLQTFSKGKPVKFKEIPICIESEDPKTEQQLLAVAETLSDNIALVDSEARKVLHVAAVFACNFTNHMLGIAQEILEEQEMDFDLLKPLIKETVNKSLRIGPKNAQTGPAKRGDLTTLDAHMEYLQGREDWLRIYKLISEHIMNEI
jgi:predicted short-subunit dehydrogenase-like oxidoreductase (DUF2520 family)